MRSGSSSRQRTEDRGRQTESNRLLSSVTRLLSSAFCLLVSACSAIPTTQPQQQAGIYASPVAYVTAAPLPEATATATLAPLPTVTAPPATAVPKREPQSSSNAIGLWSDGVQAASTYSGYLDIALGAGAAEFRNQKNALLLVLSRQQVSTGFTGNVTDVIKTNADYVLYDRNKRVVRGANGEPLLNIRADAVRNQIADSVAQSAASSDGVILDALGADLIRFNNAPIFTGTKTFTDQQRRDATEALLRAIRVRVPDKLLIIGGYAWRDGAAYQPRSTEAQELASIADGVHIEEFARSPISGTNQFKTEANWRRDVDMLAELSKDNRIVLLTTRIDAAEAGPELTRQWLNYSVATYLLGKSGARTYFQFDPGSPQYSTDPVLSAPLGAPVEGYVKLDSGLYQRKFERGIVLVNPTAEAKKTSVDAGYRTLSGNPADVSVTLTARTGLILLKQ
jgi:Hypothetical glycosyl hydrolase family 15